MGVREVEVVVGTVEVGGHGGQVVRAVLAVIAPAHLDAGNLGEGIGAVRGFESSGEQAAFGHGLRCELGIDAGRAEKQEAVDPAVIAGVNDVVLDGEVVADEVCRVGVVGENATDLGCGKNDEIWPFRGEEAANGVGVLKVKLGA